MVKWLHHQENIDAYTAYLIWVMPKYSALDLDAEEHMPEELEDIVEEGEVDDIDNGQASKMKSILTTQ
jgi:hypothetical protein